MTLATDLPGTERSDKPYDRLDVHGDDGDASSPRQSMPGGMRTLGRYARPQSRTLLLGGLLGMVANLVALLQPMAAKTVIESITPDGILSYKPLLWLLGCVIIAAVCAAAGAYALEGAAAKVIRDTRASLVSHIIGLRVGEVRRPGDLISRVTADTTLLSKAASSAITDSINAVLMLIGAVILMGTLDAPLLGATFAVLLTLVGVAFVVMPRVASAQGQVQSAVGDVGASLERMLGAFRTVKASCAEEVENTRLTGITERASVSMLSTAKWTAVARVATGLTTQIAFLVVLGLGGFRVAAGNITVAELVAFLLYLFSLTQPIGNLIQAATDIQSGLAAVDRLEGIFDRKAESVEVADICDHGLVETSRGMSVEFDSVRFGYQEDSPVLKDFSLAVEAGQVVALVGDSGAGKTTTFSLIERFVDPDAGRIVIDGKDIGAWSRHQLRSQIGYVEQDAPVLEGSLRENLTYGLSGVTDEDIDQVVRLVRLDTVVARMPRGVDSQVGHRGTTLSGGQRQRVAIARALLRKPRLLLLDEVTSQLDGLNEKAMRKVVADLAGNTTVLVIAHRLSTITDADRIVRLAGGRVAACGTHAELVHTDPTYAVLAGSTGQVA